MNAMVKRLAHGLSIVLAAATFSFAGHFDILRAIDAEEAAGRLDGGQAALYRLYAHFTPEKLPPALPTRPMRLETASLPEFERCATLDLLKIRRALPLMDADSRARALALLDDPADSSAARVAPFALAKTVTHSLTYWVETENFSIEWGQDLTNEDGSVPVRDDDDNGIPDVIELWASYFEASYAKITTLGFTDTPDLDTYKIKVFIANTDPNSSLDNMNSGYYGITTGAIPHTPGTPPARVTVNGNLAHIASIAPNDESAKGLLFGIRGAMMVTAAHELHHVFQFLYAPDSWANDDTIDWFLEGTSTWVEDEVFPFVNDYKQYYGPTYGWQLFPELPLAVAPGMPLSATRTSRIYGSAIFPKYLSEHLGGPATVTGVWTALKADQPFTDAVAQAADAAAETVGVWSMEEVFLGFAGANATMDYDDGYFYGTTPRRTSPSPELWGSSLQDQDISSNGSWTFPVGYAASVVTNTATQDYSLIVPAISSPSTIGADAGIVLTGVKANTGVIPASATFSAAPASDVTPPGQVTGVALAPAQAGLLVEWSPVVDGDLAGYIVEWKKPAQSKWTGRAIAGEMTRALVRNLDPLAAYDVRVFAYDTSANRGTASVAAQGTTLAAVGYAEPVATTGQSVINFSPWFDSIPSKTTAPGVLLTFTVTATDPEGVSLDYGATGIPFQTGASFNATTRVFSWTPTTSQSGDYVVTFLASDGVNNMRLPVLITVTGTGGGGSSGGGGGGGCFIEAVGR